MAFKNGEIMVKLNTLKKEKRVMKTTAAAACGAYGRIIFNMRQ